MHPVNLRSEQTGKLTDCAFLKVLVCGGRAFTDAALIYAELDRLHAQFRFDTGIEGDARGGPYCGKWARARR
ncbi:SLOG family protein [Mesorhizobium salmacidum]|uniref:SLOG family protein n=1 Tax=Mesorhizobium salmacidum TaxID=3015171 RepID=UPI0039F4DD36